MIDDRMMQWPDPGKSNKELAADRAAKEQAAKAGGDNAVANRPDRKARKREIAAIILILK